MTPWLRRFAIGLLSIAPVTALPGQETPLAKVDVAAVARQILDDKTPAELRNKLLKDHAALAPELIVAMTADLPPGDEEYRRIPTIWRVAIAAGRRNDAAQLQKILDVSLPRAGGTLRDWQAVVVGGGVINGISLEQKWPAERFNQLLKNDADLSRRWSAALAQAHRMADDQKVPTGTRYDALRMIALDSWDRCGQRLKNYLKKGTHAELQMGAVSALSDIDRPEVAALLADAVPYLPAENRTLALDALLRSPARKAVLQSHLEKGTIDRAWLSDRQRKALGTAQ